MVEISVCVATWNRKQMLVEIVELLEHQSLPHEFYEVIVVDSKSPDGTGDAIKRLQKKYDNLIYIEDARNILAVKRNEGIKRASGNTVVFMDDDVYPCEAFIQAHYEANKDNDDTFWCGQIRFPEERVCKSNYYRFRDEQHLADRHEKVDLPYNRIVVMNLSFRKTFIEKTGLVDERFLGYGCEDIEFGHRVVEAGYRLRYLPEAKALHLEESANINEYGNKLYKSGLYGNRVLKQINPQLAKGNPLIDMVSLATSARPIQYALESFLLWSDSKPILYSYLLYKVYIRSRFQQGVCNQRNLPPLTNDDLTQGW